MRREADAWWKEALKELQMAEKLLELEHYNYVAFHSHQAVEKALKALIIERLRILPPHIHNLIELLKALSDGGIDPSDVIDDIKDLNPHYLTSRYPDAANGIPSEVYSRRMAESCLQMARRTIEWTRRLLSI